MKVVCTIILFAQCVFAVSQENFWKSYANDFEKLDVNSSTQKITQSHLHCSMDGDSLKVYNRTEMRAYNYSVTFDSLGNMLSETLFNSDGTTYLWTSFEYADSLLVKKSETYDSLKFYTTVYSYNEKQQLNREIEISYNGDTTRIVTRKYDLEGRLIELKSEDLKGDNLDFKKVYEYFPDKNSITEKGYDGNNKLFDTREFIYNDSYDLIKLTIGRKDKARITEYEYNEFGDVITQSSYSAAGSKGLRTVLAYSYTYDLAGNWTQKTEYSSSSRSCETFVRVIL